MTACELTYPAEPLESGSVDDASLKLGCIYVTVDWVSYFRETFRICRSDSPSGYGQVVNCRLLQEFEA